MSDKKGRSEPGFFGGYTHYDDKGNKIGRSEPDFFGGYTNYDAKGNKTGHSDPNFFGGYTHYDNHGNKTGRSEHGLLGGYTHYDSKGNKTGRSSPSFTGGFSNSSGNGGCYVATCVYGSYDCPEVWTLRRFRDDFLKQHLLGRAFIKTYYAVSPGIVARQGNNRFFKVFWRKKLDRFVKKLNAKGYSDQSYSDRYRQV